MLARKLAKHRKAKPDQKYYAHNVHNENVSVHLAFPRQVYAYETDCKSLKSVLSNE